MAFAHYDRDTIAVSWRRLLWIIPAIVGITAIVAWRWLLYSESGAAWALGLASEATNGAIQARAVEGSIAGGLTVRGFAFDNDSLRIDASEVSLTADVGLLPLSVAIRNGEIVDVDVERRLSAPRSDETLDLYAVLRALNLPLNLEFDDVLASDISIRADQDGSTILIDSGRLSGKWGDRIEIDSLALEAPAGSLSANGILDLGGQHPLALNGQVEIAPMTNGADAIRIEMEAEGSLDDIALDVAGMSSSITGDLKDLSTEPRLDVQVISARLTWPLATAEPIVAIEELSLSLDGSLAEYRAAGTAAVKVPGLQFVDVSAAGTGNTGQFEASSVVLNDGAVDGALTFAWQDELSVAIDAEVTSLALAGLIEDWAGAHVLDGTVSADLTPGNLRLSETDIAIVDGERRLVLSGDVDVSGTADDWQLDGEIGVATDEFPSGSFVLSGTGSREQADLQQLSGSLLGGTVNGRASFSWIEDRPWNAELDIQNIDTSSLPFEWSANISGTVRGEGQMDPMTATLSLFDIGGYLREETLFANGTVTVDENNINARDLDIRHGGSQLRLDGDLFGQGGFSFDATVDDVGDYFESAEGAVNLSGRASLNADAPFLDASGSSEQFTWGEVSLSDMRLQSSRQEEVVADLELEIGALAIGDTTLQSIAIILDIAKDQQVAAISASLADLQMGLLAEGALDNWTAPTRWTGSLGRFDVVEGDRSASLVNPSAIEVTEDDISLSGFCLESAQGLYACADFNRNVSGALELVTELRSLPVNVINQFVDTGLVFDQTISGKFDWRQSASGRINGSADIDLTAGTISNPLREESPVITEAGGISFDIVDNDLQSGLIALPLPAGGRIDGQFEVDDVEDGAEADVEGTLRVDLPELGAVDSLIPWLDEVSGRLNLAVEMAGTVQAPVISGDVSLADAVIRYEPIGLRLSDVSLQSSLDADSELQLTGGFVAGEGRGEIVTRGRRGDSPGIEVELRGSNLTFVDLPDLNIVAQPDVVVAFDGRTLTLDGEVLIPSARVRPQNIAVTRVTESRDLVIVAGELPAAAEQTRETGDLRIEGELDVAFGDDVSVRLDLASTNLTGSTTFTWSGDPVPMANGRYDLTGTILAFGQRLEIDEGGFRFPDVSADNPIIRIRAIRDIFGNTEVRQAGVLVAGSVRRPTVETFTVPPTTEERALTLLITGSDFDYEQGVGAVDFGTYIAPRLYASYGIGLFDQENIIRLRYDVARGFGVTVTSGQKENGVDLTYRWEN